MLLLTRSKEEIKMLLKISVVCVIFACHMLLVYSVEGHQSTGLSVVDQEEEKDGISVDTVETSFIDPDAEEFIPTHEWQNVKKGQAVPSGLHIRLNLETGTREAKLLDDDRSVKEKLEGTGKDFVDIGKSDTTNRLQRLKDAMEEGMKDLTVNGDERDDTDSNTKEKIKYWKTGDKEDFMEVRQKYFDVPDLKTLFKDVDPSQIFAFLKEIGMVNLGKDHFTQEELKAAMKKFKANADDVQDDKIKQESVKTKYRSIEELKEQMKDLNMDMKTDLEILRQIHSQYKTTDVVSIKLQLLEDLEYYVHQIDNAVNFVSLGILELVLKDLNHTAVSVKSASAFVLGSAVQSNPQVQVKVLESGAIQQLIRMLSTETSKNVRNRVIYAISALIRHFPIAQLTFLQQGGMQALRDAFVLSGDEKIKLKTVTLLGDLIHEQTSIQNTPEERRDKMFPKRLQQYQMIPLTDTILELDWCNLIPTLLLYPSHDTREKTLTSMKELLPTCKQYFFTHSIEENLYELQIEYLSLAAAEKYTSEESKDSDDDTYFSTVAETIKYIREQLSIREEL